MLIQSSKSPNRLGTVPQRPDRPDSIEPESLESTLICGVTDSFLPNSTESLEPSADHATRRKVFYTSLGVQSAAVAGILALGGLTPALATAPLIGIIGAVATAAIYSALHESEDSETSVESRADTRLVAKQPNFPNLPELSIKDKVGALSAYANSAENSEELHECFNIIHEELHKDTGVKSHWDRRLASVVSDTLSTAYERSDSYSSKEKKHAVLKAAAVITSQVEGRSLRYQADEIILNGANELTAGSQMVKERWVYLESGLAALNSFCRLLPREAREHAQMLLSVTTDPELGLKRVSQFMGNTARKGR